MNVMVVLNYNDYVTTKDYIEAIKQYTSLDKIIIVDNKSPDDSYIKLKKLRSEKIDVIQTPGNEGYSSGNNYGARFAERNYNVKNIIISNPDIRVENETIYKMTELLNRRNDVAAVTGLIHNLQEEVVANFSWKLPTYEDMLFSNFMTLNYIRKKMFNKGIEYTIKPNEKSMFVDVLHGCFFAVKASVLKEVNYFDESTFLYGEENIFFYKLNEKSYKQVVLLDEKIIHMEGLSINKSITDWKKKFSYYEDSRLIYLKKYLKVSSFKVLLFKFFFNTGKYEKYFINKMRKQD